MKESFLKGFKDELSKLGYFGAGLGATGMMAGRAAVPPGLPMRPGMGRPGTTPRMGAIRPGMMGGRAAGVAGAGMS